MFNDDVVRGRFVGIARLYDAPPSFVLPVFSGHAPSIKYIQNVTRDGRIESFQEIDLAGIELVPFSQFLERIVGEQALIAFEVRNGDCRIGTREDLQIALRSLLDMPDLHDRPFMRSALAEFCGDAVVARLAGIDAIARLHGAARTQSYYQINILAREEIKRALLGEQPNGSTPPFRLHHDQFGLHVELVGDGGADALVRLEAAMQSCEKELATITNEPTFTWRCSATADGVDEKASDADAAEGFVSTSWPPRVPADSITEHMRRSGWKLLESQPQTVGWGDTWVYLFKRDLRRRSKLIDIGLEYLEKHPDHEQWHILWGELLRADCIEHQKLSAIGHEWGRHHEKHLGWPHVWRLLLRTLPAKVPELTRMGREWLSKYENHENWPVVLLKLLKDETQSPSEYSDAGLNWLKRNQGHEIWQETWKELARKDIVNRKDYIDLGRNWLIGRESHVGWPEVWAELSNLDAINRPTIVGIGTTWIEGNYSSPGWPIVWTRLLYMSPKRRRGLLGIGRQWLLGKKRQNIIHLEGYHVWERLLALDNLNRSEEIVAVGKTWLQKGLRPWWPSIWERMFELCPNDRNWLIEIGQELLENSRAEPGAAQVRNIIDKHKLSTSVT